MKEVLYKLRAILEKEGRLIQLPEDKRIIFVGDTHGDLETTQKVLKAYPSDQNTIVFLGDYVDRGPDSLGNINLLIQKKVSQPEKFFLLQGNHEGWAYGPFSPADFWGSLTFEEEELYSETLALLPFAAYHPQGLLTLHGALPDVSTIEEIGSIKPGSSDWFKIAWGDWADSPGYALPSFFGRPTFGRDYFEEVMKRLNLKVLVRSHQPNAPLFLFDNHCLTIFTSSAYGLKRRVAILELTAPLNSAKDLKLVFI